MRIKRHWFYTEIDFRPAELREARDALPQSIYFEFLRMIGEYTGMFKKKEVKKHE